MALTPVLLISGVTVSAVYTDGAVAPFYTGGTTAVLNTDYSINGTTGEITILRAHAGWMMFTFHDTSGTIAGTPEYPAIASSLHVDFSALSGTSPRDYSIRINATSHTAFLNGGSSTTNTTYVYDGTHFDIGAGSDGSFSSLDCGGAKLLFQLNVTLIPPLPDAFWTDRLRCTEVDA